MNSFKTVIALCVVIAASCSASSYKTQSSWGSQPAAAPLPLKSGGYKAWGAASPVVQPTYSAPVAAVQDAPAVVASAQPSFPKTTQQICTCVAVPASVAAQQSTPLLSTTAASPTDVPVQQAAPQAYSAAALLPASAPAPVSAPATQQFYSAPVQQAAVPLFRPASSAVRPSYTGY